MRSPLSLYFSKYPCCSVMNTLFVDSIVAWSNGCFIASYLLPSISWKSFFNGNIFCNFKRNISCPPIQIKMFGYPIQIFNILFSLDSWMFHLMIFFHHWSSRVVLVCGLDPRRNFMPLGNHLISRVAYRKQHSAWEQFPMAARWNPLLK